MEIGSLITTYYKGFYELVSITRRWEDKTRDTEFGRRAYCIVGEENYSKEICGVEMNPLYNFIQKFTQEGKPVNTKKLKACDSSFCKLASEFLHEEISRLNNIIERLKVIHL